MYRIASAALIASCLMAAPSVAPAQDKEADRKRLVEQKAKAAVEAAQRERALAIAAMEQRAAAMAAQAAGVKGVPAPPAPIPEVSRDEALLNSVGLSADGPGLLTFFRLRGEGRVKPDRLAALVERLGDSSPSAARKAAGELAAIGAPAVPALRQAVKDPDRRQTARLARQCLQAMEEHPGQLSAAAARLIGQRRPPGTAAALLGFVPVAEDEGVVEEVRLALAGAAYANGKPDPALLRALRDPSPVRRALAVDVLCQPGAAAPAQVPLRELLQDPQPSVRLRAALALARASDARAVGALIDLLTVLPPDQGRRAEDFLCELAGDQSPKDILGTDAASRRKCRDAWAAWWRNGDNPDRLLDELRKRTITEDTRQKCENLIARLGDSDFAVREKAEADVRAMGVLIVPLLRQAVQHGDLEVRRRARTCLDEMQRDKNLPLSPVTTRLIALRRPAGAAAALLAYLPSADDDAILGEAQRALNAVAFTDGKPDPVVVNALTDSVPVRRAAAGEALCLGGDREHLPAVRRMLRDDNAGVRLKAALALAGARQRDAVPVLIDLIGELPTLQSAPAEEYLQRAAGDAAPPGLPVGDGEGGANRRKRRDAWAAWWKANGDRVALVDRYPPASAEHYHGYTLLVMANNNTVVELGTDRKERWQLNNLLNPRDAQVLGPDRILVAEYNGQRVTERNRRGEVLWQKQVPGAWPLSAQRLRNGHTFITCTNKLIEVDRGGHEVLSIDRPQNDVVMARRMRDGQIVVVSSQRTCARLDATGKELRSFPLQMVWQHNGVDILPNGHVLVPAQWINRVTEYDAEGKTVFDAGAMQPTAACRLPNGNVLVAPQQWPAKVLELDAAGKQVSEFATATYVYRIRQR